MSDLPIISYVSRIVCVNYIYCKNWENCIKLSNISRSTTQTIYIYINNKIIKEEKPDQNKHTYCFNMFKNCFQLSLP